MTPKRAISSGPQALNASCCRRDPGALYDAVAAILQTFTAGECLNYFANAGYDLE